MLLDHDPKHRVVDLYRALLKLEFSRLYDDGIPVPDAIADFVMSGEGQEAANSLVRIEFRIATNFLELGLIYPSETHAVCYEEPYFIAHQINFGWFGIHYLYAPRDWPDLPWRAWHLERAPLRQSVVSGPRVDPPY